MPFTKDDIDAVSITLLVNGDTAFQIYVTRGGLTQRMGFSERVDPSAMLLKGSTDVFEPLISTVPDSLLAEGGFLDAGPGDGPRHEWRFEFAGGMNSIIYDVSYHAGAAGLPDEFADLVVRAEKLTHSWYLKLLAEETGQPLPSASVELEAPAPRSAAPKKGAPVGRGSKAAPKSAAKAPARNAPAAKSSSRGAVRSSGNAIPASRERMGLAILIDFIAWMIPWQFLASLFGGGGSAGPPGAGLMVFAILEFLLLFMVRQSPGYWLLGISHPAGGKPQVDAAWPTRESNETLAFGIGLLAVGVAGLTSWTLWRIPVPYFGIGFPAFLSVPVAMLGSMALIFAGVLVLRLDLRGVWIGGGVAVLWLLAVATGFERFGGFVDTAVAARAEIDGPEVGNGLLGILLPFAPVLAAVAPLVLGAGAFLTWKRFERPVGAAPRPAPTRS